MSPRRIRWALRAAVYVPLALLAVAVVLGMREPVVDAKMPLLEGKTAHGEAVRVELAPYGAVAVMRANVWAGCRSGRPYLLPLIARDGAYGAFSQDGPRFRIRGAWDPRDWQGLTHGSFEVEGEVSGTRRAWGRISADLRWVDGAACSLRDLRFDVNGG